MTNREAHEEAAGMGLEGSFFSMNNIDPDAEYVEMSANDCYKASEESLAKDWNSKEDEVWDEKTNS